MNVAHKTKSGCVLRVGSNPEQRGGTSTLKGLRRSDPDRGCRSIDGKESGAITPRASRPRIDRAKINRRHFSCFEVQIYQPRDGKAGGKTHPCGLDHSARKHEGKAEVRKPIPVCPARERETRQNTANTTHRLNAPAEVASGNERETHPATDAIRRHDAGPDQQRHRCNENKRLPG